MNKRELIIQTAERSGLTKILVQKTLDAIIESCVDILKQGQDISIVGFGSFKVRDKQGRIGRNPKTGEKLTIAPCRSVVFKSGLALKEQIQQSQSLEKTGGTNSNKKSDVKLKAAKTVTKSFKNPTKEVK